MGQREVSGGGLAVEIGGKHTFCNHNLRIDKFELMKDSAFQSLRGDSKCYQHTSARTLLVRGGRKTII